MTHRWHITGVKLTAWFAITACLCLDAVAQSQSPKIAVACTCLAARLRPLTSGVAEIVVLRTAGIEAVPFPTFQQRLFAMKDCHYFIYDANEELVIDALCRERLSGHGVNAVELREQTRMAGERECAIGATQQIYAFLSEIVPEKSQEILDANYRLEVRRLEQTLSSYVNREISSLGLDVGTEPSKLVKE